MRSPRTTFLAIAGTALLGAALALLPGIASACGDKDKPCPCGAACPESHQGDCAAAGGCGEKKAGTCACAAAAAGGGDAAAPACPNAAAGGCPHAAAAEASPAECPHAAAGGCPHAAAGACPHAAAGACPHAAAADKANGGAKQQAVLDPATGELTVPGKDSAPVQHGAEGTDGVEGNDAAPSAPGGHARQVEIEQPGGGVMAPFPADRASKAVANVNESNKAHAACAE
jgi:hypothetical protein